MDTLAALIFDVSHLTSSTISLKDLIHRTGELVFYSVGASRLSIAVRDSATGDVEQYVKSGPPSPHSALFVRAIKVRGVNFGQLELSVVAGNLRHNDLLQLVDILASQLSLMAENSALFAEGARLGEEYHEASWSLKVDKVLTRAAGIVAVRRNYSTELSLHWLKREAVLKGQPIWRVAELLIANHQQSKSLRQTA